MQGVTFASLGRISPEHSRRELGGGAQRGPVPPPPVVGLGWRPASCAAADPDVAKSSPRDAAQDVGCVGQEGRTRSGC